MSTNNSLAALFFLATLGAAIAMPCCASRADDGNFMIRILGSGVLPDSGAAIAPAGGTVNPALGAEISDEFIPATTLTYFLNNNLAVELFCCFANHQAKGNAALSGGADVADFWIFPPSLTLQYHFTGAGRFKPYVGAGVTYIHFFDEDSGDLGAGTSVDIDDAFGFALQVGTDVALGGGWNFNVDVKKIWIDTEAQWRGGVNLDADIDIDPVIVSAGLGYRFNLGDLFGRRAAPPLK